ncbi:TPA: hypothetical protein EYP26_03310 [Candidatus Bathyarchaeota archaeon]|nr:hypothetical protein [Candidatus Bathyarchaeota archaeon]
MGRKAKLTVYVDKTFEEAKEMGLKVSKTCENALKDAIIRLKGEILKKEPKIARFGAAAGIRTRVAGVPPLGWQTVVLG